MRLDEPIITDDILSQLESGNKVARIHIENRFSVRPVFDSLGAREMKATHILAGLTKPEAKVFMILEPRRDYRDNRLEYSTSGLTPTEKTVFTKGFKGLVSKKVIERIKRGRPSTYMFNPDFLLPSNYEEVKAEWDKIK